MTDDGHTRFDIPNDDRVSCHYCCENLVTVANDVLDFLGILVGLDLGQSQHASPSFWIIHDVE